MEISVRQTSMKPSSIRHLLANGIVLVSHLNAFDPIRLSQKTKLKINECEDMLAAIKPKRPHYVIRASELMVRPFEKISTLIPKLDKILDGGIKCGQLTEVSGEAGAGKSNFCATVGTLVMLPKASGGSDGHVLLIHTEGEGKLKLAIRRFNTLAGEKYEEVVSRRLHVINCTNEFELLEIVHRLPDTLDRNPDVKLIIVDSITCAFITTEGTIDREFYDKRNLRLTKLVKILIQIAWERRLTILATNHVSYNFKFGQNIPAMGKTWSHMSQTKIYLERNDSCRTIARFAHVTKGASNAPEPIRFTILNCLTDGVLTD